MRCRHAPTHWKPSQKAVGTPITSSLTRIVERKNLISLVQSLFVRLLLVTPGDYMDRLRNEKVFDKVSWLGYMSKSAYIFIDIWYFFCAYMRGVHFGFNESREVKSNT